MTYPGDYIDKIICGDCYEVMQGIPDDSIDLIVTDPPYQLDIHNHSGRSTGMFRGRDTNCFTEINGSWNMDLDIPLLLASIRRLQQPINAYVWCSHRQLREYLTWAADNQVRSNVLVWVKRNPAPLVNNTLMSDLEYCVHFTEKGSYLTRGLPRSFYSKAFHEPRVLNTGHPTPKPIKIMSRHIAVSSHRDSLILDPFVGSGTTAVASKQLGRPFIGIEINPAFCSIAADQLKQEVLPLDL